jgi:hypothetical protein
MTTQRKHNSTAAVPAPNAFLLGFHNPAITAMPETHNPSSLLSSTNPQLIENVLVLYDSRYSDSQFASAFSSFHRQVEFMDPGLHLHSVQELQAQFTYLRRWFTRFHPMECELTVSRERIVLDLLMDWWLLGGRVKLEVRHMLRVRVQDGKVVQMEDAWSLNDRVAALLSCCGLYEGIRYCISAPSTAYMRWRLGL